MLPPPVLAPVSPVGLSAQTLTVGKENSYFRWVVLFSIIVWLLAASAVTTRAADPKWIKLTGPDFVVYSDASEKDTVDCALRYAAYREIVRELFVEPGRSLTPSRLILFRSEKRFTDHINPPTDPRRKTTNRSIELDGTSINTFHVGEGRETALRLTFEFETIWTLARLGYHVPVWMSQGAGEVLSTIKVKDDKFVIGRSGDNEFHDRFEWPRFFEINEGSSVYRSDSLGDFLGQSWGLMHWILLSSPTSQRTFRTLADRLVDHDPLDAVSSVMQCPPGDITKRIRRHLSSDRSDRAIAFDARKVKAAFVTVPATEAESLVQVATVLEISGRIPECNIRLDRARELSPELQVVKEAFARRMQREGRPADFVQFHREAIVNGSTNYYSYLVSALQRMNDASTGGRDVPGQGGAQAVEAVAECRSAVRLNPGDYRCYAALGRALYVVPTVAEDDIAELSRGVAPGREGAQVLFYRALLQSRLNHFDEAVIDLRSVMNDSDCPSELARMAEDSLVRLFVKRDMEPLQDLVKAKSYAPAYALLAARETDSSTKVAGAYRKIRDGLNQTVLADLNASEDDRQLARGSATDGAKSSDASRKSAENEILDPNKLTSQPKALQRVPPQYPLELHKAGTTGEALVEFIVTRHGDVVNAFVVRASHPLFGAAAVESVSHWRFVPGIVEGRRVNTRMQQAITFSLADDPATKPKL